MRKLPFLLLFLSITINAQPIVWDGTEHCKSIGKVVLHVQDSTKRWTIEEVSSEAFVNKFEPCGQEIVNLGITDYYQWLKIPIDNKSTQPMLLEFADAFLPICDLYWKNEQGNWEIQKAGYKILVKNKPIESHYQVFKIPTGRHDFYVRCQAYSSPFPIKLWNENDFKMKANWQTLAYGIYTGLLLFVVISNLFLFFSLHKSTYLLYSFVVLYYLVMSASVTDGFAVYFFPGIDLTFTYRVLPPSSSVFAIWFCLSFLEVKKYSLRRYRAGLFFMGYFLLSCLSHFFTPLPAGVILNQINAPIALYFIGATGVFIGRKGNRLGYYLAAAYLIFFALIVIHLIYLHTGKPPHFSGVTHTSLGMLVEAFIFNYLLSKRFEWEKAEIQSEKETAQRQLLDKTIENEKFVLEQNAELENKVARRTEQLQIVNENLNLSLKTVEHERQKSESLLLNILPEATANELKEKGFTEPQNHSAVTVLFIDIKDFTRTTAEMSPEDLVSDLNYCFSKFDEIVLKYGIEKIKTIGDAYLAVSGLPVFFEEHATNAVKAALEMQVFMANWQIQRNAAGKENWNIRIGMHTGPVMAGVVGTHKFAYDIWGDTVNTAARMESNSQPGKINISEATFLLIKKDFNCVSRGLMEVKGKGAMEMFWVEN